MAKKKKLRPIIKRFILTILLVILIFVGCEVYDFYTKYNKVLKPIEIHNNDYYINSDFGINSITSKYDYDEDGIDDYTDILDGAKKYAEFNPKYVSAYYAGGYPSVEKEGVCTDLIWYALQQAGYDLKNMMSLDISSDQKNDNSRYEIKYKDDNIDFRRVSNQEVFFKTYFEEMKTDITDIKEFQAGDIIVFDNGAHIAIVSDKRNKNGIPYIIQNRDEKQEEKEEDRLEITEMKVTSHYRFTFNNEIKRLMNKVKAENNS